MFNGKPTVPPKFISKKVEAKPISQEVRDYNLKNAAYQRNRKSKRARPKAFM